MHHIQRQLMDFHRAMNQPIGTNPEMRTPELRASLIEEEAKETVEAIRSGDFVEAIDGMCDLLYVVFGTAVAFGIDLEPFFEEVHRTNMLKTTGAIREDGKRLKPEGWKPPDIEKLLNDQKDWTIRSK